MKFSAAALGFAATALAVPGGAPSDLKPKGNPPEGCSPNHDGDFMVTIFKVGDQKRDAIQKRDCGGPNTLVVNLHDGVLKDSKGRIGSIVANYQFQFDGPPAQAGAIYTSGFSTCNNGSLALGSSTVFYQCLSGEFYNLYDRHWAAQCNPVEIVAMPCSAAQQPPKGGAPGGNGKQPVGTSMVATTVVTVLSDGQPQVVPTTIAVPMCQIGDGQIQAHTTPCDKVPVNPPVTQITDGQIQAPTNPPVISQISDGQVQAPTGGAPISQISDGQVQAPTGAPVTQISDGQIQAPTTAPTGPPVSQISDGQIQAPTGSPSTVPTAGAGKDFPHAMAALFAAGMGAVFFL